MTTGSERLENGGKHASEAEHARTPAAEEQAVRATRPVSDSHPSASDKEHRRAERSHWKLTGAMSVVATGAALAAAWFAAEAYKASWQAVVEAQRQTTIAQNALNATLTEQRAWIGAPEIVPEISRDRLRVIFTLAFRNVGKVPTRGLYIGAITVDEEFWKVEGVRQCEKGIKSRRENIEEFYKASIIPGDKFIISDRPKYIDTGFLLTRVKDQNFMKPHIVGCVVYETSIDSHPHKTMFVAPLTVMGSDITIRSVYTREPD